LQPQYALLEGAIAGRALYDGRLDARAALALIAGDVGQSSRQQPGQESDRS
jgi:phosphoribosylformimino-5-aminoimidazole carboxamide ribotide isomerase